MTTSDTQSRGDDDRAVMRENLARNLLLVRGRLGVTQQALARNCQLHQTQISKLERGEIEDPALFVLMRLSYSLCVPVDVLVADEDTLDRHLTALDAQVAELDARMAAVEAETDPVDDRLRQEQLLRDAREWWLLTRARLCEAVNATLASGRQLRVTGIAPELLAAAEVRLAAAPNGLMLSPDPVDVAHQAQATDEDGRLLIRIVERRSNLAGVLLNPSAGPELAVTLRRDWPAWTVTAMQAADAGLDDVPGLPLDQRALDGVRALAHHVHAVVPQACEWVAPRALADAMLADDELRLLALSCADNDENLHELFNPEDGLYPTFVGAGPSFSDAHGRMSDTIENIKGALGEELQAREGLETAATDGEWIPW